MGSYRFFSKILLIIGFLFIANTAFAGNCALLDTKDYQTKTKRSNTALDQQNVVNNNTCKRLSAYACRFAKDCKLDEWYGTCVVKPCSERDDSSCAASDYCSPCKDCVCTLKSDQEYRASTGRNNTALNQQNVVGEEGCQKAYRYNMHYCMQAKDCGLPLLPNGSLNLQVGCPVKPCSARSIEDCNYSDYCKVAPKK